VESKRRPPSVRWPSRHRLLPPATRRRYFLLPWPTGRRCSSARQGPASPLLLPFPGSSSLPQAGKDAVAGRQRLLEPTRTRRRSVAALLMMPGSDNPSGQEVARPPSSGGGRTRVGISHEMHGKELSSSWPRARRWLRYSRHFHLWKLIGTQLALTFNIASERWSEVANLPHHSDRACVSFFEGENMSARRRGKIGWILLWLLGVPIPVLLILFLIRGCT
jgi:hypothetical protein